MKYFKIKRIREIEDFKIPKNYAELIKNVFDNLKKEFKHRICLLVLTGSGGRERIIEGWSDLDLLIVLDELKKEDINKVANRVKEGKIKVGTTVYSKREFEEGLVDTKTIYNLELIRKNILDPNYQRGEIKFPYFSEDYRRKIHKITFPNMIHTLSRSLYSTEIDIRTTAKAADTIMKFILSVNNNELPVGYLEVQEKFYRKFPRCPKIHNVFELMEEKDLESYREECLSFLEYLKNNKTI